MARPKLPDDARRTEVLQLRLTKAERLALDMGAAIAGVTVSDFIRDAALIEADTLKKSTEDIERLFPAPPRD